MLCCYRESREFRRYEGGLTAGQAEVKVLRYQLDIRAIPPIDDPLLAAGGVTVPAEDI